MSYKYQARLLRKTRENLGWTQAKVSEFTKDHRQYISNAERAVCSLSKGMKFFLAAQAGKPALLRALNRDAAEKNRILVNEL